MQFSMRAIASLSHVRWFVCLRVCVSVCLCVCLSVCLSVCWAHQWPCKNG